MTILAQAVADASVKQGVAAIADGSVALDNPQLAIADGTVDLGITAALFPRGEKPFQIVAPFQIRIDGVIVPSNRVLEGTTIRETIDGAHSFNFQVAAEGSDPVEFSEPLGTIDDFCGPPANGASVDIDIVYLTASGPRSIRLLTNGIITASQRDYETGIRTFAGNGPRTRYDRQVIDIDIPAGAGLTAVRQVNAVMAELSLVPPTVRPFILGRRRYRELAAKETRAIDLANRILAPESRVLFFDRDARPSIRSLILPEVPGGPTLTAFDVLTGHGGITESTSAEGPTEICVRGIEQVLGGLDGLSFTGQNGRPVTDQTGKLLFVVFYTNFEARKRIPVTVTLASFVVPFADKKQDGTGAQSPSGVTPSTKTNVVTSRRDIVESVDFCTVTIEDQKTFGWYQRERSVATTNITTQVLDFIANVLIDSITNRGVIGSYAAFIQVQRVVVSKGFDADGFLVGEDRRTFSHYQPRRATRDFNPTTERYEYRSLIPVNLSGDGVTSTIERFIETERETQIHDVDGNGFLTKTTTLRSRYFSPPAPADSAAFSYGSGFFSDQEAETFALFETIEELFEPLAGDTAHRVTTIIQRNDGTPRRIITSPERPGFLPAAEKKQESIPDPRVYPFGMVACPNNQRAVEGCFSSGKLNAKRPAWTDFIGADRIEDADEALDLAKALLGIANAARQSFSLPVNGSVRPGLEIIFSIAPHAIDRTLLVEEVVHSEAADGMTTRVTGRFDVA